MGYRSQVRSVIYGPPDKMGAFITERTLIAPDLGIQSFLKHLELYEAEMEDGYDAQAKKVHKMLVRVLQLTGENWKWYPGYPDVEAWEQLQNQAEEYGLDYEFLRIGEGDGSQPDVEHTFSSLHSYFFSASTPQVIDDTPSRVKALSI